MSLFIDDTNAQLHQRRLGLNDIILRIRDHTQHEARAQQQHDIKAKSADELWISKRGHPICQGWFAGLVEYAYDATGLQLTKSTGS
jgi:hypothetical protein